MKAKLEKMVRGAWCAVLGTVCAIGFTATAADLTGSVASVSADDLLAGRVPGVQVTSVSGQPGAAPSIRVRGYSSQGNSSPLFIIDGVQGDLSDIPPDDIESIDVLKDAAASALYGARAANGVILVTTKQGTAMPIILVDGIIYIGRISDIPQSDIESMTILKDASSTALYGARAGSGVILVTTKNPRVDASLAPLYVVDGVAGGDFSAINPADIMSLEVLKDASATALYGAKGANGVIIITTKRAAAVSEKDRLAAISSGIGACASNMFQRIQSAPGRADFFADCHALAVKAIYERPEDIPGIVLVDGEMVKVLSGFACDNDGQLKQELEGLRERFNEILKAGDGADADSYGICELGKAVIAGYDFRNNVWRVALEAFQATVKVVEGKTPAQKQALLKTGGAWVEAIYSLPPAESEFRTAFQQVAEAVEGKSDAQALAIGKIAASMLAAMAREPEVIAKSRPAFAQVAEAVAGKPDAQAQALGEIGSAMMDAMARWPEQADKLVEAFPQAVEAVAGQPDAQALALGTTGKSWMDAMAREPEAIAKLRTAYSNVVAAVAGKSDAQAEALGDTGASMMDAMARQPEAIAKLAAAYSNAVEAIAGKSDAQALALGTTGKYWMDAMARQPEQIAEFRAAYSNVVESVASKSDAQAYTLGGIAASMMDAMARQPEQIAKFDAAFLQAAELVGKQPDEQALGLRKAGMSWMDAMARQPEVIAKLRAAYSNVVEAVAGKSAMQALATGGVGSSMMDAMARQPEVIAKLRAAYSNAVEAIAGKSDAQALAIGTIGASMMDAMARQPEFCDGLVNEFSRAVGIIAGRPDAQAEALGRVGSLVMDAMARHPDQRGKFGLMFVRFADLIKDKSDAQVQALGGICGAMVDATMHWIDLSDEIDALYADALDGVINYPTCAAEGFVLAGSTAMRNITPDAKDVIARQLKSVLEEIKEPYRVPYLDWDGTQMTNAVCTAYEFVTADMDTFKAGTTYVVKGEVETADYVTVEGTGDAPTKLILCDSAKLTVVGGISVNDDNALVICGQEQGTGELVADADGTGGNPGIGGEAWMAGCCGAITINGGTVTALGDWSGAGIGGGEMVDGGVIAINGGTVTAVGRNGGEAIGCGADGSDEGTVSFGARFVVKAGANATNAVRVFQTDYANDHGAAYARIEPARDLEEVLKEIFPAPSKIEGTQVILGEDIGPVELSDDLGEITIALNGWKIVGTDGADGDGVTPGADSIAPITIVPGGEVGLGATALKVVDAVEDDSAEYLVIDLKTGSEEHQTIASVIEAERFTNEIYKTEKLVLRWIPEGDYAVGFGEETDHNLPAFTATVNDGYYIGLFEFTEAQYSNALGVAGCTSTRPLTAVTWNEFDEFLKVLNKKTSGDGFKAFGKAAKKSITLPTELQWEIAARGGSAAEYGAYVNAAGKTVAGTADNFGDFAWYVKNNTPAGAKPVGLKRPNAFGLYDTAGNVWEWCLDSWETPYDTSRTSAEEFCTAEGTDRVMRGGSYNDKASVCRPSYRGCNGVDYRDVYNGFRLALVNSEGPEPVERPEPGKGSALVCGDGGEGNPAGKGCTNGVEIAEGASSAVTVDIDTDAVQVVPGKDGREIAAVTFLQRYPWNGLVDIGFALKLEPAAETDLLVTVYDGETTLDSFAVPAAADASGAFATNIVWDAAAAGLAADFQSDNVFVEVEADRSAKSPALLATACAGTIYGSRGSNGVIIITTKQGAGAVPYLDWDDVNKKLTNATCTAYEVVTNDMDVLEAGKTYVVMGNVTNSVGIVVEGTADNPTYLILCDGAKLVSTECFRVVAQGATTNALVICGQENGTGVLEASSSVGIMGAGIGGGGNQDCGIVTINGGTIVANGFTGGAAGIGGGRPSGEGQGNGGTVTINGGTVTAIGTTRAEGIGRGWNSFGEKGKYSGTVKFGSEFTVLAGDDAESAMPVAQEDYERDHSAKYVHIEQAPRSWRVASSAKGRVDLRPAVALVADPTEGAPVSNVTWSTTYWAGYIGSLSVNIGWTNLTSGVAGTIETFRGSGVTNVALPAYSGEYRMIHSVGDLESFVTFTVDGLTNRTVMLPTALAGCHYVVSNLTTGAEIAASGTLVGGAEYDLPIGDKIAIYAVPGAGYTVIGTNPYVIEKVTQLTDVDMSKMPTVAMVVPYLDWDDEEKKMTNALCTVYETVTAQTSEFEAGKTYVVKGSVVNEGVITVNGTEDDPTCLILCDGASLEVNGIIVNGGYGLVICGQEKGTGELLSDADGNGGNPGIGGEAWSFEGCGAITINGGTVTAIGDWAGAGIGGGEGEDGGAITINGGKVTAVGNVGNGGSMAIGCGADGSDEGTVSFGSEFIVKAGDSAERAVCVAMESYAADHTARYVRIAKASDSEGTRLDPWYVGDQPKWGVEAYTNELADAFALHFANAASSFDLEAPEYAPFRETARVIVETDDEFWIEPSLWRASDGEEYGSPAEAHAAGATNAVPVFYDEESVKIPSAAEIERSTNGVNLAEWRNVGTDVSDPLRATIVDGLRRIADAENADVLLELVPEDTNTVLEAAVDGHIDAILSELGVAEVSRAKSVVDLNGWLGEAATNEFSAPVLLVFPRQIDNGRISFMMRQDTDGSVELLPEFTSIFDLATTNSGFLVDRDLGVVYVIAQKLGCLAFGEVEPETYCSIVVGDGTKTQGEEDPASLATNFTVYAVGKGVSAGDFVGYCERMKGEAAGKYAISFMLLKKPEGFPRSAIVVRPGVFTITDDVDIVAQWAAEDRAAGYPTNGYAHVRLGCDPAMGKVKGEKVYKLKYDKKTGVSSVKVSISATAAKDYVFAGWYLDPGFSTPATFWTGSGKNAKPKDYRETSQSMTVTDNTYLFARFVKKSSTADPISWLRYAGAGYCGADASWLAEEETWYQGVALPTNACQIAFGSLSLPTVTVSGLPAGVKFDKTTCRFMGVPTAASTEKKPFFTVKVTVKNKSGANDVLVKNVYVEPLPAWAVGNFDGYHMEEGVTNGTFAATVGKTGKVSGKTKGGWADTTFSAKNFSEVKLAEDGTNLVYAVDVTVSYKDPVTKETVKEVDTLYLAEDAETGLGVIVGGDEDGCGSVGVQRAWDRKDLAFPAFATGKSAPLCELDNGLTLKFGAKGKVTLGGKVNGVKMSGTTYVMPVAWHSTQTINLLSQVPVYVAPKRNSTGFCAVYDVLLTVGADGKFTAASALP